VSSQKRQTSARLAAWGARYVPRYRKLPCLPPPTNVVIAAEKNGWEGAKPKFQAAFLIVYFGPDRRST
jgi:hypothetical protein